MFESELNIINRFENINHLTEKVIKKYDFMIKIVHSLNLFFIEGIHLPTSDNCIIIKINNFKPIINGYVCGFILFC